MTRPLAGGNTHFTASATKADEWGALKRWDGPFASFKAARESFPGSVPVKQYKKGDLYRYAVTDEQGNAAKADGFTYNTNSFHVLAEPVTGMVPVHLLTNGTTYSLAAEGWALQAALADGWQDLGAIFEAAPLPEASPAAVVFTDLSGTARDTYTIPAVENVTYLVDGTEVAAGTYPGTGTVTVTAQVAKGYQPGAAAELEWTHDFSSALVSEPLPPRGTNFAWGDQSGDGIGDIITVDANGFLTTHFGTAGGLSGAFAKAGGGWQNFTWISHTPDVNGDGIDDLLGLRNDGIMFMYYGQGMGQFGSARIVGTGWGSMAKVVVVGDMNGDGSTEVAAVGSNGNLYRYTMTTEGLKDARHIGKNWLGITTLSSVGDFNGDGTADILATNAAGDLLVYYAGNGGVIIQAAKVGQGWGGFTAMFAPGDLTGDAKVDLVGRRADGSLFLYSNNGNGRWGAAQQIGSDWNDVALFA